MFPGQCASMSSDHDTDCQGPKPGYLFYCISAVCESRRVLCVHIIHVYYTHNLIIRSSCTSWTVWIDCMRLLTFDHLMRCMDNQELECMYTGWQHQCLSHVAIQPDMTIQPALTVCGHSVPLPGSNKLALRLDRQSIIPAEKSLCALAGHGSDT